MFAANKLVLNLDTTNIMKFTQIIHHILHYTLVTRKVYRRDGKYIISLYQIGNDLTGRTILDKLFLS
jgi:hypothetical protein